MAKILTTTLTRYRFETIVITFDHDTGEVNTIEAAISRFQADDTRHDQVNVNLTTLVPQNVKDAIKTRLDTIIATYKASEGVS